MRAASSAGQLAVPSQWARRLMWQRTASTAAAFVSTEHHPPPPQNALPSIAAAP